MAEEIDQEPRTYKLAVRDLKEWAHWVKDGTVKFEAELSKVIRRMSKPPVQYVETATRLRDSLTRIQEELSKMERELKRSTRTGGT